MGIIGAIRKIYTGVKENKRYNKMITELESLDRKDILDMVSDRTYARLYLKRLEYYELTCNHASVEMIINKSKELTTLMEDYISKNKQALMQKPASHYEIANLMNDQHKLQTKCTILAQGVMECDKIVREAVNQSNIDMNNLIEKLRHLQEYYQLTQQETKKFNLKTKSDISNLKEQIEDIVCKLQNISTDTKCLYKDINDLEARQVEITLVIRENYENLKKQIILCNEDHIKDMDKISNQIMDIISNLNELEEAHSQTSNQLNQLTNDFYTKNTQLETRLNLLEETTASIKLSHQRQLNHIKIIILALSVISVSALIIGLCF